jgi:hypothetical protein
MNALVNALDVQLYREGLSRQLFALFDELSYGELLSLRFVVSGDWCELAGRLPVDEDEDLATLQGNIWGDVVRVGKLEHLGGVSRDAREGAGEEDGAGAAQVPPVVGTRCPPEVHGIRAKRASQQHVPGHRRVGPPHQREAVGRLSRASTSGRPRGARACLLARKATCPHGSRHGREPDRSQRKTGGNRHGATAGTVHSRATGPGGTSYPGLIQARGPHAALRPGVGMRAHGGHPRRRPWLVAAVALLCLTHLLPALLKSCSLSGHA